MVTVNSSCLKLIIYETEADDSNKPSRLCKVVSVEILPVGLGSAWHFIHFQSVRREGPASHVVF